MVETTKDQVFLVDCKDNLYWRQGITDQMVIGEKWVKVDENVQWVAANDNGEIWAIKNGDELWKRTKVTSSMRIGEGWEYSLSYISKATATNGYGLWAIDSRDFSALHRSEEALAWTGFQNDAVKMAGHWFKVKGQASEGTHMHNFIYGVEEDIWGISGDGRMQYRQGVSQTNHKGTDWIKTDNRKWAECVGNYDRSQMIAFD